jgi:hippurate hydrolase
VNDAALTQRLTAVFREVLGRDRVLEMQPIMASEDFARYGAEGVPTFFYQLGIYPPERVASSEREGGAPLPYNHSDHFAPVPEPTIRTGVLTMCAAVLDLLARR